MIGCRSTGKIQHNLGQVLVSLAERESGAARFEEALTAYRAAFTERKRDRVPFQWASTQYNLGIALETLGEREAERRTSRRRSQHIARCSKNGHAIVRRSAGQMRRWASATRSRSLES